MILARIFALVCVLAVVVITSPRVHSAERAALQWEWTAPEQKRITSNATRLTKGEDGYWENKFKNISVRTKVSAELAVAGFYYLETAVETFGKVSGVAFSKTTYGQVRLVIHDKLDDF